MGQLRLVCLCSFLLATTLFPPPRAEAKDLVPWGFDIGHEIGQFKYDEPGVMKERGLQKGMFVSLSHHFFKNFRAQLYGSMIGGDLDYDGWLPWKDSTGNSIVVAASATSPNLIINGRIVGGYRLAFGSAELTPFTGYGYRWVQNYLGRPLELKGYGKYDDPLLGYWRDQTHHYLPLGLIVGAPIGGWRIEGTLEYDVFLRGEYQRDYDHSDANDDTFTQRSGSGYRFAVKVLSRAFFNRLRVTIEPFYEHWQIDDSDPVIKGDSAIKLSKNNSTLYGLRIGIGF